MGGNDSNASSGNVNATIFPPFQPDLVILGILHIALGIFCCLGNIAVIAAVWRTPSLRNNCNKLLVSLSLADLLAALQMVQIGWYATIGCLNPASGLIWMKQTTCLNSTWHGPLGFTANSTMLLLVGVDRFVSVQYPVWYKGQKNTYVAVLCGVAWLYAVVILILAFLYVSPTVRVAACYTPPSINDVASVIWNRLNIAINVLVFVVYAAAYLKVRSFAQANMSSDSGNVTLIQHVMTSLIIVVVVYLVSKVTVTVAIFFMTTYEATPKFISEFLYGMGLLALMNIGSNPVILYVRSQDYRKAINRLFSSKRGSRVADTREAKTRSTINP